MCILDPTTSREREAACVSTQLLRNPPNPSYTVTAFSTKKVISEGRESKVETVSFPAPQGMGLDL